MKKILVNAVTVGSTIHRTGSLFDDAFEAALMAEIVEAGGVFWQASDAIVADAAAKIASRGLGGWQAAVLMLAALTDTAQAGAANSVVVFRPGDPLGSRGNVVVTDVELFERLVHGQGNTIVNVDDSLAPAILSTPGTYDMLHVVFTGNESQIGLDAKLHWREGVKVAFGKWPAFTAGIQIEFEGSTPAITIDGVGLPFIPLFRLNYRASIKSTGTGPFISIVNSGAIAIASTLGAGLLEGAAPVVSVDASSFVILAGGENANVESNVVDGAGFFARQFISPSANIPATQGGATPIPVGDLKDPILLASSSLMGYTPAIPGDWPEGVPATSAEADDKLAARGAIVKREARIFALADLAGLAPGVKTFAVTLTTGSDTTLPADARYVGHTVGEQFSGFTDGGAATYTLKLGTSGDDDSIVTVVDVASGQIGFPKTGTVGARAFPMCPLPAEDVIAELTSDQDLNTATGLIRINLFFQVKP